MTLSAHLPFGSDEADFLVTGLIRIFEIDGEPLHYFSMSYLTQPQAEGGCVLGTEMGELRSWFREALSVIDSTEEVAAHDLTSHGLALNAIGKYLTCRLGSAGSFFLTSSGFPGVEHPATAANDVVAFVENSRLPTILRPAGDEYMFVRLAHVGSAKEGDLEAFWRHSRLPLQEITVI